MPFNSEKPTHGDRTDAQEPTLDRFDLLSAYLDGEVTTAERQQVQYWLETDEQFQRQYRQCLRLHQGLTHLPPPAVSALPSALSDQLFRKLDRQRHQRHWAIAGGLALLALATTLFSQLNGADTFFAPKLAQKFSTPAQLKPEPLMLALNRPLVEIPASAE